jgi:hypothetical protein
VTFTPGVDYAWSHPGGAALQAAGKKFACRYLSHDPAKNLTRAEATDLATHGIWSVVVWESTDSRALSGRDGGITDAKQALSQASAAGMPPARPIYFAVDFDAAAGQQAAINAYLDGAASVLGAARVGIYGGYWPVARALDGGHAQWGWQTAAWSGGKWDARAHIRQGAQVTIGGVSCDLDTAMTSDFGQWMPGVTPNVEDNMPLSQDDRKWLETLFSAQIPTQARAVWTVPLPEPYSTTGEVHATGDYLRYGDPHYKALRAQLGAQAGLIAALTTAVKAGGGLTAEQATAAAEAGAKAALAELGTVLTHPPTA